MYGLPVLRAQNPFFFAPVLPSLHVQACYHCACYHCAGYHMDTQCAATIAQATNSRGSPLHSRLPLRSMYATVAQHSTKIAQATIEQ